MVKSVGKPDARKGHVRFDERGRETGGCQSAPHRALPRLYAERLVAASRCKQKGLHLRKADYPVNWGDSQVWLRKGLAGAILSEAGWPPS
jgi:hypothetical protein